MSNNELFSKFFRMETTFEENLEIGKAARRRLEELQAQMDRQGEWEEKVGRPAQRIFADLSIAFNVSPDTVKRVISKKVTDLKTAATEKDDRTAQAVLLVARGKFEKAKIHPPEGFPYLDWVDATKKN